MELLKTKVWSFVSGCDVESNVLVPPWNLQVPWNVGSRSLVVLDDVWSLAVLQQLTCRLPGCKTLVVSRTKLSMALDAVYEVELLREDESISLFCHAAFGQKTIPPTANENLVKEVVLNHPVIRKLNDTTLNLTAGFFCSFCSMADAYEKIYATDCERVWKAASGS